MIHVGVGRNGFITLEEQAHSTGYFQQDIYGRQGPLEEEDFAIQTICDVEMLVDKLHESGFQVCDLGVFNE
jgi:pyroglutamyl-peptidase